MATNDTGTSAFKVVSTKNFLRLISEYNALKARRPGTPALMVVWGKVGYGKTTAVEMLNIEEDSLFVRALDAWTRTAMLRDLCTELELKPARSSAEMVRQIIASLKETPIPIFIDEAEYAFKPGIAETLRDISDLAGVPLVFVGMGDFRAEVKLRPTIASRVSRWVEFKPLDLGDARKIVDSNCAVKISDDLLTKIVKDVQGTARGIMVAIGQIETAAARHQKNEFALATWTGGDFAVGQW